MKQIESTIQKSKDQVTDLVKQGQRGELETQPGRTMIESFEQYVNKVLNTARDHAGKSAQSSLDEGNSVKAMVTAGSKGSFINISQIIGTCLSFRIYFHKTQDTFSHTDYSIF
jgi:DNA-directed RNA polymerase II subunit RPB1